ncbi:hypothetical protein DFP73DRAFT_560985 [Morchella snyderi]|nr:hypothetical protein DFP73DRAFT_560985 [Morchella snyderi]
MIQQWFLHTYQRHISVTQVNSIIHTCGEVPQSRFSHRRDTPRKDYNYEEAMERERVVVWRWYTQTGEQEGRNPTMSRVASWWETADGGRMLGMSTLSSILTKMKQRQYEVVQVNEAAKHQANMNKPTLRGGMGAESRAPDTGQATGSLKRRVAEDCEDEDDLIGPWCKPGKEAEVVLTELLQNKRRTGYMYPGTFIESLKPQAKRRKLTPPPDPPEVVHEHVDIEKRMWNWWRRHRDSRRISTANIVTKIENYWTELEKAGPVPDFNEFAESFKIKYNLVTNEGGPYPADMLFMYQGNGPTMSTKIRGRRFPENNKPWC